MAAVGSYASPPPPHNICSASMARYCCLKVGFYGIKNLCFILYTEHWRRVIKTPTLLDGNWQVFTQQARRAETGLSQNVAMHHGFPLWLSTVHTKQLSKAFSGLQYEPLVSRYTSAICVVPKAIADCSSV